MHMQNREVHENKNKKVILIRLGSSINKSSQRDMKLKNSRMMQNGRRQTEKILG